MILSDLIWGSNTNFTHPVCGVGNFLHEGPVFLSEDVSHPNRVQSLSSSSLASQRRLWF